MLNEKEANSLMTKLIDLRTKFVETNDTIIERQLKQHEELCINKFKYIVMMRVSRYKTFINYEDLRQQGFEALVRAMKTFKLNKGSFFAWSHQYIKTSIARHANMHTTIRYPLRIARELAPHREYLMPTQIDEEHLPDQDIEEKQTAEAIKKTLSYLPEVQRKVIELVYGIDRDEPASINYICKTLHMSRSTCLKKIDEAFLIMREKIAL